MKKTVVYLIILLCFCTIQLMAQNRGNCKITTVIINEKNNPIENTGVELVKSKDSSLVKFAFIDKNGLVEFENIRPGSYRIKVSLVNYTTHLSIPFTVAADELTVAIPKIILQPRVSEINEVVVTGRKPFIQRLADRLVVNVESSIVSAGSSAMDVLERSPGVSVDQNDVIGLRGKQGVIIMVDGKPSPLTGTDLANYLRGLPAGVIERIDLITNPSAKYDAAGNSGIIDIRMKKDQRLGTNGTFTTGYGQGIYPKANAGGTFNYRNKKINLFGNYNYAYREQLNHLILDRSFFNNGVYNGGDLKNNYATSPVHSNTARAGMDFFPDKKTVIGFVVNGNFNKYGRNAENSSLVFDPFKQATNTFTSLATNDDHSDNTVGNINFKHTFDSTGKELTADIDYGQYHNSSLTTNATKYFKLNGSMQQPDYVLDGDQKGTLSLQTAKLDYTNPFKKGVKLETGFKASYVSSDNDAKFFDVSTGTAQNDVNKTNHFSYEEYNTAGYLNISKDVKKFNFQVGLRGEHTHVKTFQEKGNIWFDSSYFQLFPSAFFNYKIKEDQTIGVSVSRRIDRPGYSQLNPFLFLIDVSTYATGSPGLLPQLTWSYELNYTLKNLNFTLGYSHTKDNQNIALVRFKDVFPTIPTADNVTVQIPVNLASSDYIGLTVSAPVKVKKWWNMINNANLYYNHFNGNLAGTTLNNGKPAFDARINNTFTLGKTWVAELNGSFNSGGQYGFMVLDPQYGITAGVQKNVLKNKATVRFNITDIFWTNLPKAVVTYNNYIEKWHAYRETRVANLSFTYRFGKNTVQAARRRTTASEEERQRAGN
jgi:iron complex outermembrane receptor protein